MPGIDVTTPRLPQEKKDELAKRLYETSYPYLNNRQIMVKINEVDYYVNGLPRPDKIINLETSAGSMSDQEIRSLCKELYLVCKEVLGDLRCFFTVHGSGSSTFGINGLMFDDYKKASDEEKGMRD